MDETFTSPFGPELTLSSMVCQPDGKLVVAGRFSTNPPMPADQIKRLLPSGDLDTCIAIRTIVLANEVAHLQAGAGIVADSDPAAEDEECLRKLAALERAIDLAEGAA